MKRWRYLRSDIKDERRAAKGRIPLQPQAGFARSH